MTLITNSRVACYAACPRKHDLAYNQRIRPLSKPYPLRFGTLVHIGLEAWWRETAHLHMRLARAANAVAEACEQSEDYDEWDLIKAQELLAGYDARWSSDEWETIHVEHEFRLPLFGQHQLGGKIDALARRNGQVYVVEHKTSSEDITPGSDYWQRLTLDSQVSTYLRAAKELGHDVTGCMYDVLHTIGLKPYKAGKTRKADETTEEFRLRVRSDIAERPDFYYQRGTIVRTEREAEEAQADLLSWSKSIVVGGYAPRNTKACKTLTGTCSYIGICQGTESADDTTRYYIAASDHEELTTLPAVDKVGDESEVA